MHALDQSFQGRALPSEPETFNLLCNQLLDSRVDPLGAHGSSRRLGQQTRGALGLTEAADEPKQGRSGDAELFARGFDNLVCHLPSRGFEKVTQQHIAALGLRPARVVGIDDARSIHAERIGSTNWSDSLT
jgi:hypothetical protein